MSAVSLRVTWVHGGLVAVLLAPALGVACGDDDDSVMFDAGADADADGDGDSDGDGDLDAGTGVDAGPVPCDEQGTTRSIDCG